MIYDQRSIGDRNAIPVSLYAYNTNHIISSSSLLSFLWLNVTCWRAWYGVAELSTDYISAISTPSAGDVCTGFFPFSTATMDHPKVQLWKQLYLLQFSATARRTIFLLLFPSLHVFSKFAPFFLMARTKACHIKEHIKADSFHLIC